MKTIIRVLQILSIACIIILFTQCRLITGATPTNHKEVYAHVMNYSHVIRLDEHDLWGFKVSNYGCDGGSSSSLDLRKLEWEGDSFSTEFTQNCGDFETTTTRITGKLSSDKKTLESFSGRTVVRISNDSIVDNKIYTVELALKNLPLTKDSEGSLTCNLEGTDLSPYVSNVYFSFAYKYENRKPESFQEVTTMDLSDPDVELSFLLHNWSIQP